MIIRSVAIASLFILSACGGQAPPPPPAAKPAVTKSKSLPGMKEVFTEDFDPNFVETTTVTSATGPAAITRNILQDRNGDIWLTTWEGIIKYDGEVFTNYTNKDGLRKFHVFSCLEDRDGGLWFGTIGAGVYRYDGETFTNITTKDGLANDRQGTFLQARNGDIWIGTMGGISIFNGKSFRNLTTKDSLLDNDINAIVEDRGGKMWIGSRGELCVYDGLLCTPFRMGGERFFNVRSIIEDRAGNIWIAGNNGLWRYGEDGLKQFDDKFVGYVYQDRAGNIWTSSVSGVISQWRLSRYAAADLDKDGAQPTVVLDKQDMFFGILEDEDGGIWLGTLNGVGRYDGEAWDWFR